MTVSKQQSQTELFKYKDLKVYSSTEWLAGNRKKYRQVFEQDQLSYIYAELSIINKNYEIEAWHVDVLLKCFKLGKQKNEICSLEINRTISKHDHLAYIREGWGQKDEGVFWKKGQILLGGIRRGQKTGDKVFLC